MITYKIRDHRSRIIVRRVEIVQSGSSSGDAKTVFASKNISKNIFTGITNIANFISITSYNFMTIISMLALGLLFFSIFR
jgi:hypothetical protein